VHLLGWSCGLPKGRSPFAEGVVVEARGREGGRGVREREREREKCHIQTLRRRRRKKKKEEEEEGERGGGMRWCVPFALTRCSGSIHMQAGGGRGCFAFWTWKGGGKEIHHSE